jgi:hypothetical protein
MSLPKSVIGRSVGLLLLTGTVLHLAVQPALADEGPDPVPLNEFKGHVLDPTGQNPIAGARVTVVHSERGFMQYNGPQQVMVYAPNEKFMLFFTKRNGLRSGSATTDADGNFVIKGLEAGQYNVLAVHTDKGVRIIEKVSQPNEDKHLDIVLDPPTFVEGTIKGLPSSGMRSGRLEPSEHKTSVRVGLFVPLAGEGSPLFGSPSPKGEFKVGPLPVGDDWRLSIGQFLPKRGFQAPILEIPLTVEAGKTNRLDLDLTGGATLAGQVNGPKGETLEDVSVTVRTKEEPTRLFGTVTATDGKYTLAGLAEGDYVLEAKRWARRTKPG